MDGVPLALAGTAGSPAPDAALVARAAAGEDAAREALAAQYRQVAYLLALHLTGHREDARDLAQEAMVRLFAHLPGLHAGQNPRPWLLTVVRNLARDLWRRRRLRPTDSIDEGALVEMPAPGEDPERTLQRRQRQQQLWRALATLPLEKREVLVLRDFHDLSYAEIAGVLGVPAGTVMSRLHAARVALRVAFHGGAE